MKAPESPLLTHVVRPAHLALTFLTTFPLPHVLEVRDGEFARASGFYPLAGWAVGALAAALLWLPLPLPEGVRAALVLAGWLAATGLLHFDGLVDTSDAVFAMKSPERRLEILRDVHVGAFGLATGALVLLAWWSALGAVRPLEVLAAAVLARTVLLAPMNLFPAARVDSLGARSREGHWPVALLLAAPLLLLPLGPVRVLVAAASALVAALLVARFCASRLGGGINGDVYGACVVAAEVAVLLSFAWGR
ncbi:adenosylcobinamide-GDP ribazoletransferase [Deinococcus aquiradiocola]|uniref:Adenosylcobinamide-GDP ribazoletransferase n=1 Tax=Deinococcus aquiradiocola TaxID=393059 RepID=A0A917P778_9DEIO|nr:adenosylcobinamide-GDP ribazoletransferase [Deinococcus aquiradiocola]GGJ64929.1 adenosylcobinamide-GDP ribazoletransferase [Deinococcus aquiradiocola]